MFRTVCFVRLAGLAGGILLLALAPELGGAQGAQKPRSSEPAAPIIPPPALTNSADAPAVNPEAALTKESLNTFFDGLMRYGMAHADAAGGVIVVVKDGHILFAQGYGYANA